MRTLLIVPIIHAPTDMGTLAESIKTLHIQRFGQETWQKNVMAVDRFWVGVHEKIETLCLPYARVRLYQDGLPVSDRAMDIVRDLARAGSRNHELLLELVKKGASLIGTESPELLLKEYALMQQISATNDPAEALQILERQKDIRHTLLHQRDQRIAKRINATLREDEIGILFIGMLHSPERWLAPDIHASRLVCSSGSLGTSSSA